MAEAVAGSYAQLGCTEIVNDERTTAYLLNGLRPGNLQVYDNCGCTRIRELVGCDISYLTPTLDNAPWFSADIPESARFAGFLVTEFEGLGSTFTRTVTETINDGAVLGRSRLAGRTLTWRGFLLGADCCAVAYGLRWLTKTLRGSGNCNDCRGEDLTLLFCCPDDTETGVEAFRLLKNVGLIAGPTVLSDRQLGCGCGASCITEIEFSLMAAQPYLYSSPIPLYTCVGVEGNSVTPVTDDSVECSPVDCGDVLYNDALFCPDPILPPTAVYVNSCFNSNLTNKALYLTVPRSSWGELEEVVPVITISTGNQAFIYLSLGFYTSSNDNPCGDLLNFPPDCDVICDKLQIVAVPANSKFYLDGRTKKMSVICSDGSVFPGDRYASGPWSWPSFSCYGFCLELLYPADLQLSAGTCISLSLVPRTS